MATDLAHSPSMARKAPGQALENKRQISASDLCLPLRERIIYEQLRDLQALGRENMIRQTATACQLSTAEVGDATARLAIAGLTALAGLRMAVEGILEEVLEESYQTFRDIVRAA